MPQQPDGTYVLSIPGNPDAPVAQIDAGSDTGNVPVLLEKPYKLTVSVQANLSRHCCR
jgi:hypothetical protein